MNSKAPISLYFNITEHCNNGCTFCASQIPEIHIPGEIPSDLVLKIYKNHDLGFGDDVVINGGEPSLYKDLNIIINEATVRGAEVILFTNGRLFCNFEKASDCLALGLKRLSIPLHGSRANTHEKLTKRTGSFKQTIEGIHNAFIIKKMTSMPEEIELKLLAVKNGLFEWTEIIELLMYEVGSPDRLVMSGLNMWCRAKDSYGNLTPTFSQMQRHVNSAIEFAFYNNIQTTLWSIPLCVLTEDNLNNYFRKKENSCSGMSKKLVYYDPKHIDGIEHADESYKIYKNIEPECMGCNIIDLCGPGIAFYQQIKAFS
jgi:organic radical activating enzyme